MDEDKIQFSAYIQHSIDDVLLTCVSLNGDLKKPLHLGMYLCKKRVVIP